VEFGWGLKRGEDMLLETFADQREMKLRKKEVEYRKTLLGTNSSDRDAARVIAVETELAEAMDTITMTLDDLRFQVQTLRRAQDAIDTLLSGKGQFGLDGSLMPVVEGIRVLATAAAMKGQGWARGSDSRQRIRNSRRMLMKAAAKVAELEGKQQLPRDEVWRVELRLAPEDRERQEKFRRRLGRSVDPLYSPAIGSPLPRILAPVASIFPGVVEEKERRAAAKPLWAPSLSNAQILDPTDTEESIQTEMRKVTQRREETLMDALWNEEIELTKKDLEVTSYQPADAKKIMITDKSESEASAVREMDFIDVEVRDGKKSSEAETKKVVKETSEMRERGLVVDTVLESESSAESKSEAAAALLLTSLDVLLFLGETAFKTVFPVLLGGGKLSIERAREALAPSDERVPVVRCLQGGEGRRTIKKALLDIETEEDETDKDWQLLPALTR